MPELHGVVNGVGYSPHSQQKQADFKGILAQHAYISKGVLVNPRSGADSYTYLDLNAGPGYVPEYNIPGSPIVALEILSDILGHSANYHFCEHHASNMDKLCAKLNTDSRWMKSIHAYPGDNNRTVDPILKPLGKKHVGLAYHDPTDTSDWALLRRLAQHPNAYKMDILIYVSGTNHKRAGVNIKEEISTITKRRWIIRELYEKHHYTFLLGSNWVDYPAWHAHHFYPTTTERGRMLLDKVSMNKADFEGRGQGELFC